MPKPGTLTKLSKALEALPYEAMATIHSPC